MELSIPFAVDDVALQTLWQRFVAQRRDAERDMLAMHYQEYARTHAAMLYGRRTHLQLEFADYLQYARVGLLEAIERYDPVAGARFETYAARRIQGAILNGIAHYTEMQEQIAARQRVLGDRLAAGAKPAPGGDPAALFGYLAELAVGLALGFALEDTGMVQGAEGSYQDRAYAGIELRQMAAQLRELLAALPERPRMVLSWHYLQERSFEEIARELGVTKGRVSQLHREGLQLLRERWRSREPMDWWG